MIYFGESVAIGDGTIVVGAKVTQKGSDSGSVYLFEKSSSGDASSWTQVAKLTADDGAAGDDFGKSVAISDGTIVVGAPVTTIKVLVLVPCTSSRRALPATRARGRKWQSSPPTTEQRVIISV